MIRIRILLALLAITGAVPAEIIHAAEGGAERKGACNRNILDAFRKLDESSEVPPPLKPYVKSNTGNDMSSPTLWGDKIFREESNALCDKYVWTHLNRGRYAGDVWNKLNPKQQAVILTAVDMAHNEVVERARQTSVEAGQIYQTGVTLGIPDEKEGFKFSVSLSSSAQISGSKELLAFGALDAQQAVVGNLVRTYHQKITHLDQAISKLSTTLNPDHKRSDRPVPQGSTTLGDINALMERLAKIDSPGASCRGALAVYDQGGCRLLAEYHNKIADLIKALNKYVAKNGGLGKNGKAGVSLEKILVKEAKAKEKAAEQAATEEKDRIQTVKDLAEAKRKTDLVGQAVDAWTKRSPPPLEQPALVTAGATGINQKELGARPSNLGLGLDKGDVPSLTKLGFRPPHSRQLSLDSAKVATAKAIGMDFGSGRSLALPALTATLATNPTKAEAQEMIKTAAKPGFWGRLFGKKKTPAEIEETIAKNYAKLAVKEAAANSKERLKLLNANREAVSSAAKDYNKAERTAIAAYDKAVKEAAIALEKSKKADKNNPGWGILEQATKAHEAKIKDAENTKIASINAADKAFQDAASPSRKAYDEKFGEDEASLRKKEELAKAQAARAEELYQQRKTVYIEDLATNVKAIREDPKWLKNNIPAEIQKIDALNNGTAGQDRMDQYFAQEWSDDISRIKNMQKCEERGIRDAKKCIAAGFTNFNKPKLFEPLAGAEDFRAALDRPTPQLQAGPDPRPLRPDAKPSSAQQDFQIDKMDALCQMRGVSASEQAQYCKEHQRLSVDKLLQDLSVQPPAQKKETLAHAQMMTELKGLSARDRKLYAARYKAAAAAMGEPTDPPAVIHASASPTPASRQFVAALPIGSHSNSFAKAPAKIEDSDAADEASLEDMGRDMAAKTPSALDHRVQKNSETSLQHAADYEAGKVPGVTNAAGLGIAYKRQGTEYLNITYYGKPGIKPVRITNGHYNPTGLSKEEKDAINQGGGLTEDPAAPR